jgi:hypothetical protein
MKAFVLDLEELFKYEDVLQDIFYLAINKKENNKDEKFVGTWEYDKINSVITCDKFASLSMYILNSIKIFSNGRVKLFGGKNFSSSYAQPEIPINNLYKINQILSAFEKDNLKYIDLDKLYKSKITLQTMMCLALNWNNEKHLDIKKCIYDNIEWKYYEKYGYICGYIYSIFNERKKERILKICKYGKVELSSDINDNRYPFKYKLEINNLDDILNILQNFKFEKQEEKNDVLDLSEIFIYVHKFDILSFKRMCDKL